MKTLKILFLFFVLLSIGSFNAGLQAQGDSELPGSDNLICHCNTSCTECAANGADPLKCAEVAGDGYCSVGATKCTN